MSNEPLDANAGRSMDKAEKSKKHIGPKLEAVFIGARVELDRKQYTQLLDSTFPDSAPHTYNLTDGFVDARSGPMWFDGRLVLVQHHETETGKPANKAYKWHRYATREEKQRSIDALIDAKEAMYVRDAAHFEEKQKALLADIAALKARRELVVDGDQIETPLVHQQ